MQEDFDEKFAELDKKVDHKFEEMKNQVGELKDLLKSLNSAITNFSSHRHVVNVSNDN
eukprot:CAMPEP_0176341778 /NCGR_PEP_ID=MMETSP0126-20121128/2648_1 /TAXON_ID=141414 ORGANISM="Strombidinopsis acuminatum, Strain SPMC142" /NCGR_SAMPLE_ID=MMETSP0126 /ASSEMBLY_ACC=CAM_ASM_000229 /LENGTH=57 /DNA_ID=CAMNT_0017686795 /DNA_START=1713 /DNA_END=1886 /DNA_ORIENTATION=-